MKTVKCSLLLLRSPWHEIVPFHYINDHSKTVQQRTTQNFKMLLMTTSILTTKPL